MKYLLAIIFSLMVATPALANRNIVLIFDESGSMADPLNINGQGGQKMVAAQRGVITVIGKLPDDANFGILTLTHGWIVPMGPINKPVAIAAVNHLKPDGGTPLGGALKVAADALLPLKAKNPYGHYSLLVVTDGEATDAHFVSSYTPDILSRGIVLDVIGVRMNTEHQLAKVARTYKNVSDEVALNQALNEALAETKSDANANDSDFQVIAPLPNDLAHVALTTLADFSPHAIGSERPKKPEPKVEAPVHGSAPVADAVAVVSQTPAPSTGLHPATIVVMVLAVLFLLVIIVILAAD